MQLRNLLQSTSIVLTHALHLPHSPFYAQIFALSFHITYGTEIEEFADILTSWDALFKMPFAEEWQNMDTENPRPLTYLFYIIFLILAVLMLNLLIAIVTQVYPQKLSISDERWKTLVRDLLLKSLVHQRRLRKMTNISNANRQGASPPGSPSGRPEKSTLESCLNDKLILEGMDGYVFWRNSKGGESSTTSERMDQEDNLFRDDSADYLGVAGSAGKADGQGADHAGANSGNSLVSGEAWQKLENGLKDQQEKFSMLRAKMNALEESLGGVVEMAKETLQINKMLSTTTQQVLQKRQGRRS